MNTVRAGVTIVALAALGAFLVFLLNHADDGGGVWDRYLYLYSGLEAIAFAGVGWLFGREVHRAQAETAQQRADEQTKRADAATEEAVKERERGQAFAGAVVVKSEARAGQASEQQVERMGPTASGTSPSDDIAELAALAQRLYPSGGST
jgi:hypothetical protein